MLLATKVETLGDDGYEQAMLSASSVDPVSVKDSSQPSGPSATTPTHAASSRSAPQSETILKQANHGDLDWSYTSRCVRRWSPNSLLTHLYSHAFSVPPRDTKFSSPFVNINLFSQDGDDPEVVSLPQAYRLPLLMVAKYLWESVHSALSSGREGWMAQTTNIFHISRLCENLFAGARIKTAKGGMEIGWRCLMFDRFLTRFYNHWVQNDPASNEAFWKEHEAKEYDKDVLKHDWKKWSLQGLNGVRLTEQEIGWGLSADHFKKTLTFNRDSQTWILGGNTLSFITSDEGPAWSSVSELTDLDLGEDEDVKPSLDSRGSILPAPSKEPSGARSSTKRLRFPHRSSPRKAPDQARISTLRKSARTPSSALPRGTNPQSPLVRQTISLLETDPSQSISSIQTPTQSSSRNKQGLVVLIKRRPQVTQAEQNSIQSTNPEMSIVAPSIVDLTQPSPPPSPLKRVVRPSSRRKEGESDVSRRAKRRKIDGFDLGKGNDLTPVQVSTNLAPRTPTNGLRPNGVLDSYMRVDVSVQTTPTTATVVEQETQTDGCIGPGLNVDRDVVMHTPTLMSAATKTTSDIAIEADPTPLRDDNSLKVPMGTLSIEGCTMEMQKDLSLVVDSLVSSRMISLMRALKQSSDPGPTEGSSSTDSSSPTLCEGSALASTSRGASGVDRNLVNGLFDEVRLLREEAHAREQRTREEMQGLRHLHNAEVDSLRRRLAYLESHSQEQVVKDCDTRRNPGESSYRGGPQYSRGNSTTIPPRHGDKSHHFPDDDMPNHHSFDAQSIRSPDQPVPAPFSNVNGFSGRLFPTEDSPLPSKAQRKSHIIAFSRPSAIG